MPIFLDRHDLGKSSAEDLAELRIKDLQVQEQYGVKFLTYCYDSERGAAFCLIDAPDEATAERVHGDAHGHVANEMIQVELSAARECAS